MGRRGRPVGPDNLRRITDAVEEADYVLVGWGSGYVGPKHAARVMDMIRRTGKALYCLGRTAGGSPIHPARFGVDTATFPWEADKDAKSGLEAPEDRVRPADEADEE